MGKISAYAQAESYLLSLPRFTAKNTFEDTRAFYEYLGKPGSGARLIHVAGTNGKGSVCAYMDSCLRRAGYSVGLFTSPHLVTMRERIRFDGERIGEAEFLETFKGLLARLTAYGKPDYHPTFFESLFFLAMLYLEEKQPQAVVLETGLGGRLDATNVVENPAACVIGPIGLDHTRYLGSSYEAIAREKAGIIKKGGRVVYRTKRQECDAVIEKTALNAGAFCRKAVMGAEGSYDSRHKGIDFSFCSRYYGDIPLTVFTKARYQQENVCLALTALEEAGFPLTPGQMREGVGGCAWEGRMEEALPGVFLDGAHNPDGVEAFLDSVRRDGCRGRRWLLFAVSADKDYARMAEGILQSRLFEEIAVTPLAQERGLPAGELGALFDARGGSAAFGSRVFTEASRGLEELLRLRGGKDYVYAAGSLYLVGELKAYLACGGKGPGEEAGHGCL